ncbi:MAG: VanZ family protein [Caldilineaceae bacterium]
MAFATATVLLLGFPQLAVPGKWRQRLWTGAILAGATLISYSRLYLGHHYPSDVLAGMVVGCAVGAAAYGVVAIEQSGAARWRWLLWPQVAVVILATQMAYMAMLPLALLEWPFADKVLHFLLFGMVAFWLNLWMDGKKVRTYGIAVPLAILIPLSLAFTEECLQSLSPVRTFDLMDLSGDVLGMYTFWWISERFILSACVQSWRGWSNRPPKW